MALVRSDTTTSGLHSEGGYEFFSLFAMCFLSR